MSTFFALVTGVTIGVCLVLFLRNELEKVKVLKEMKRTMEQVHQVLKKTEDVKDE